MSKKTDVEDFLPELTDDERSVALKKMLGTSPWSELYAKAPVGAKKRIEIAYLINQFAGKYNMWLVREERSQLENELSIKDLKYLAEVWPAETGKEHYQHLLLQACVRPLRTDARFSQMVAALPKEEADLVFQTMVAVLDLEAPIMMTRDLVWDGVCGSVDAQALLGDCFLHAHEVLRNVDIAAYWLCKAAPFNETSRTQLKELEAEGLA